MGDEDAVTLPFLLMKIFRINLDLILQAGWTCRKESYWFSKLKLSFLTCITFNILVNFSCFSVLKDSFNIKSINSCPLVVNAWLGQSAGRNILSNEIVGNFHNLIEEDCACKPIRLKGFMDIDSVRLQRDPIDLNKKIIHD